MKYGHMDIWITQGQKIVPPTFQMVKSQFNHETSSLTCYLSCCTKIISQTKIKNGQTKAVNESTGALENANGND